MSVRIRLTRTGRKNLPSYRIGVFDTRTRRDGPALEVLGWYNPLSREAGKGFKVRADRLEDWIRRGARPSLAVEMLFRHQGVALPPRTAAPAPAKPAPRGKALGASGAARAAARPDKAAAERRRRKLAKRASRKALAAKRAAAAKAAPAKKE